MIIDQTPEQNLKNLERKLLCSYKYVNIIDELKIPQKQNCSLYEALDIKGGLINTIFIMKTKVIDIEQPAYSVVHS